MTTDIPKLVAWASQECAWQESGELSVGWLINGWKYAYGQRNYKIRTVDILKLGALIEPQVNANGFRTTPVTIDGVAKMDANLVPSAIGRLVAAQPSLKTITDAEATEFYRQFEEIHPFVDGNGRAGALIWNWMRRSLVQPTHGPQLWGQFHYNE